MPYWNFEYTKAVIYTVVKVGGGIGQDPATKVTHLRLNQPPVFSSVHVAIQSVVSHRDLTSKAGSSILYMIICFYSAIQ